MPWIDTEVKLDLSSDLHSPVLPARRLSLPRKTDVARRRTRARPVVSMDPSGQRTTYPSVSQAAAQTGGQQSRITYACRTGTLYRGIAWEYEDEIQREMPGDRTL